MQQLLDCLKGQIKDTGNNELNPSSINIYVTNNIQIKSNPAMAH